jgi:hypothetical protein
MFIELTDHLRCIADHEEAYLVLLPDRMEGRSVVTGTLGCPVCGWITALLDGVVDFGGAPLGSANTALTPEALQACFGLSGPGGYVALVGAAAAVAPGLAELLPGVRLVTVNPPPGVVADRPASVLRAGRLPLKASCLRGIAIGRDLGADAGWVTAAARSVLPGLRLVVEGPGLDLPGTELLAASEGVWVATKG